MVTNCAAGGLVDATQHSPARGSLLLSSFPSMTVSFRVPSKTALVKQFIAEAGSSIVSVKFIKSDGSLRVIQFNPRDRQEIKGTGHALKSASTIRCRDFRIAREVGQGAWRSFDCERVVSIKAKGKELSL